MFLNNTKYETKKYIEYKAFYIINDYYRHIEKGTNLNGKLK